MTEDAVQSTDGPVALSKAWKRFAASEGASVAVVGDIMLDRYLMGGSERISPEGPVPVVLVESEMARLGGADEMRRPTPARRGYLDGTPGR